MKKFTQEELDKLHEEYFRDAPHPWQREAGFMLFDAGDYTVRQGRCIEYGINETPNRGI